MSHSEAYTCNFQMSYFLLSDFPFRFGLSILESCTRLVWEFRDFPFLNLSEADTFRDFAFPVFRFGVWFWNFDFFHVWDFLKHFQVSVYFLLWNFPFPAFRFGLSIWESCTFHVWEIYRFELLCFLAFRYFLSSTFHISCWCFSKLISLHLRFFHFLWLVSWDFHVSKLYISNESDYRYNVGVACHFLNGWSVISTFLICVYWHVVFIFCTSNILVTVWKHVETIFVPLKILVQRYRLFL